MKERVKKKIYSAVCVTAACLLAGSAAEAGTRVYVSPKMPFTIDDVQCDSTVRGTACLDTVNPLVDLDFFKDSLTHYAIDSAYGYDVLDFDPSVAAYPRPMDGVYVEGYIAEITDTTGNVIGVAYFPEVTVSSELGRAITVPVTIR